MNVPDNYMWPMKNKEHKPFIHQIETTEFLLENKRAFLLSDMGTGKTLSALWASDILMIEKKIKRVLIVTPLSTMQIVWGKEIFENFPHRTFCVAHGTREYRIQALNAKADYIIINHDGVTMLYDEIIKSGFDLIIIDELTAFKNNTSNRTKAMKKVTAKKTQPVWGLTGEPTPNGPSEAFGQAKVVNPFNPFLPKYFKEFQFKVEYCVSEYLWFPTSNANNEVFKILQPAIRYERDKCIDIPPCVKELIEIPMTSQQTDLYNQMKRELMIEYEQGIITAANAGVKILKLLQISSGAVKDDNGGVMLIDDKHRMDYIEQTIDEMGKRKKIIIFCAFRAAIAKLHDYLEKRKLKVNDIHGSVQQNDRAKIIREFQDGDTNVLIIQPQSCAHGVTLTAANVSLWQSLMASGEVFNQANARITRIGQDRKQYIKLPYSNPTEKRLISILDGKDIFSRSVLSLFSDL